MASLVLGAAGAVVGSIFGGPLGASLGWAIGSALGGLFEKKKGEEGPRLTDLHLQNSQYGLMIPIVYGTVRIAGNVVWQTDLQEHKTKSGGKGGGPSITTYTYSLSFAVEICEGPIVDVRRIWANKRLKYSTVSGQTLGSFPFTLYLGTLDQLPDPTIEADKGVGNVPAYRGYALGVFDDIPMEEFGNAMPSLEWEVVGQSGARIQRVNQWTAPHAGGQGYLNGITFDGTDFVIATYGSSSTPSSYTRDRYAYDGSTVVNEVTSTIDTPAPSNDGILSARQVQNSLACALYIQNSSTSYEGVAWAYDGAICAATVTSGPVAVGNAVFIVYGCPFYHDGAIYAIGGQATVYVAKWNAPDGVPDGSITSYYVLTGSAGGTPSVLSADVTVDERGTVWVFDLEGGGGSPAMWKLDSDLNLIAYYQKGTTDVAMTTGHSEATVYAGYVVSNNGLGGQSLSQIDGASFPIVDTLTTPVFNGGMLSLGGGFYLTSDGVFKIPAPINLKLIVDDISDRCGLDVGEYETDDLTQIVNGYVISQQTDARSCLEPLMTAYFCDAVESGPAIKYVNRGSPPDETIDVTQLGACLENESPGPLTSVIRTQEVDLPRTVNVSFFDIDADYQVGAALAKREVVRSVLDTSITFALVLSMTEAKAVADRIMYDSWAKRRRISFSLPRKYSYLEPTDVKIVNGYTVVLTQRDESVGGVLKFDAVATRAQIFAQSGAGGGAIGSGGFVPPTPKTPQEAQLLMLDLPLISDSDYPNGHYAAMAGSVDDSWGGGELDKSIDGGTTYSSLLTTLVADTIGTASTVLADFFGGNIFDNINSVTVVIGLGGGTLTSTTELGVLNGANEAMLGDEIIQFTTATLTAPSTYALTGLLRGRRGTEFATGLHGASEDFVLLPASININGSYAELGVSRKYKGVTSGTLVADATAVDFTNNGVALRPYSAVLLGGGRNEAGDIILNWTPRTRTNGEWVDYVDATMSDANDWELSFFTDATYASAILITNIYGGSNTYTLSVADQVTLYGSPSPNPLYWSVRQIGAFLLGTEARGAT